MSRQLAAVTGASSGIGAVFARKLAAQGYDLLLVARRQDRLEQLAGELSKAYGIDAQILPADLATIGGVQSTAWRFTEEPRLALLVNNAGFGAMGRFFEAPLDDQVRMHRLHIDAILQLSHAALIGMTQRNEGAIINVASVAGFVRAPGSLSYCATKAWINAFTEGLYLDLKSKRSNVKVQALCPGFTYSEFHDVAGMDRKTVPDALWLKAEDVVDASLAGLRTGKLFVVPGWKYKLLVAFLTKLPASLRLRLELRRPRQSEG
jgi:short-subunit dehydrogenase